MVSGSLGCKMDSGLVVSRGRLDRRTVVIVAILGGLAVLAWVAAVRQMRGMSMGDRFDPGAFAVFVPLWVVMMAAMMFPSVWPAVTLHGGMMRHRAGRGAALAGGSSAFVGGYLLAWTAFGIASFVLLVFASRALGGVSDADIARFVVAPVALAGAAYQFTPLKRACLHHCRGPLDLFMRHWRDGRRGALSMGARHGTYCVGCCWLLMGLMLAVGLSSIAWMAIVAAAIGVEKLIPGPERLASAVVATGFLLVAVIALVDPGALPGFVMSSGGMGNGGM
jgi:predicted metal-binding membrane protein